MPRKAVSVLEDRVWRIRLRPNASTEQWFSFVLVVMTPERRQWPQRSFWLGWNWAERRLGRTSDLQQLYHRFPRGLEELIAWLEAETTIRSDPDRPGGVE